ncbi:MAG: MBL fold metallo-hydrolase [Gemmatimonadota bacterium]|jgi:ribonuclease Z
MASSLGCDAMVGRVVEAAVERQRSAGHTEWLDDGALHVVLCGTGSPLPDPTSAAACTAVVAGGRVWVVDVGPGSQEVAQLIGVPRAALGGVLLTHFHSDHIGELGEWAMQSWVAGRDEAFHVYGPPGVRRVAAGFRQAYGLDDEYRIAHHGLENMPRAATEWTVHEVPVGQGEAAVIHRDAGLTIEAFAVDHAPVAPAVGYRFEYGGRSVVISGDTDVSPGLQANARGADLLVHEVLLKDVVEQLSEAFGRAGDSRLQRLSADILEYHTSPAEALQAARDAGVDTMVMTHLVPPIPGRLRSWLFTRGLESGDVEVVLGEDGMHFRLPPGSETIEQETLGS